MLAVVGGNFYFEVPVVIQAGEQPVVWFGRDNDGLLLLNVRMLTKSNDGRALIEDNYWLAEGVEADIECPPSGKRLRIDYATGDHLQVQFRNIEDEEELVSRYRTSVPRLPVLVGEQAPQLEVSFPLTAVEIEMEVAGTAIRFGPGETKVGGVTIAGSWMIRGAVGIQIE
jgi:hypothetical protein